MTLRRLRLHLHAMPLLELVSENRVDESVLLDDGQALELLRDNVESVHRAAASADVLDLIEIAVRDCLSNQSRGRFHPLASSQCKSFHVSCTLTSNLTGFKPSFSILKTLSSFSSK